jgi:hypothetical protein
VYRNDASGKMPRTAFFRSSREKAERIKRYSPVPAAFRASTRRAGIYRQGPENYPQYEKCLAPGQSPLLKKYAVTFRLPGLSHAAQRVLLAASLTISHPFKQVREAYAGQIRAA